MSMSRFALAALALTLALPAVADEKAPDHAAEKAAAAAPAPAVAGANYGAVVTADGAVPATKALADASLTTVTSGGVTQAATIVKLGANPNSLIYYLVWPTSLPATAAAHGDLTVEAFDSAGRSLATLGG